MRIGLWLVLALMLAAGGFLSHERSESGRNCRICAATYNHCTLRVYGIPIWSKDTQPKPTADTRNYFDRYLAYPHDHEWTGGGFAVYGTWGVGCGRCSFGPYPQHQRELTRMGFRLVAASGMEDPLARRRYFESILQPPGDDHFVRVWETFMAIDDQIPDEPWGRGLPYRVWNPVMEGIAIPPEVRAGQLVPSPKQ